MSTRLQPSLCRHRWQSGQMTVEFAYAFPALLLMSLVALYAFSYLVLCARFDGLAHEAIRIETSSACAPDVTCGNIQTRIQEGLVAWDQYDAQYATVAVTSSVVGFGHVQYVASVDVRPLCFRLPFTQVMGWAIPGITHHTSLVVSPYRRAVVLS